MAGIWPGETQCVAMLTFDVDGVSSWLNRNPDFKTQTSPVPEPRWARLPTCRPSRR